MLGREHHVGGAEKRVRPCCEDIHLQSAIRNPKSNLRAFRSSDPILLHQLDALGPVDEFEVADQALGVGGDAEHPLLERAAVDGVVAAVGAALVGHFLVRQHRAQRGAPVDRHLGHVGQALVVDHLPLLFLRQLGVRQGAGGAGRDDAEVLVHQQLAVLELVDQVVDRPGGLDVRVVPGVEHLQEDPLGPAVVLRVGGRQAARPVVREAEHLDLPLDVGDVALGGDPRVDAVLDGVLLGGQAERVVAHRVEDLEAFHAFVARDDVRGGVALGVADVQARAAGVREHVEDVEFRVARVEGRGNDERLVVLPVLLPLLLDYLERVDGHRTRRA